MKKNRFFWKEENESFLLQELQELSQAKSFLANESLNPPRFTKPQTSVTVLKFSNFLLKLTKRRPIAVVKYFCIKRFVPEAIRILLKRGLANIRNDQKIQKTSKVLCVSHFIGKSEGIYKDKYFGDFFSNYGNEELSYYLINQTTLGLTDVTNYLASNFEFDFKVGEKTSSLKTLSNLFAEQYQSAIELQAIVQTKLPQLNEFKQLEILLGQFNRATINNLVIISSILRYIEGNNLERIVITFEGNAYESCLYHEISRKYPKIEFIFLQHAPVTPNHIGIKNQLKRVSFNAKIGTSGYYMAEIFQAELVSSQSNEIANFGSPKFRLAQTQIPRKLLKVCLLAPEGVQSAVEEMLELSQILASQMQDFYFVFRVHPVLGNLVNMLKKLDIVNLNNFEISTRTIEEDFARSGVCIYRGSSVAIEGAAFGVIPIFYSKEFDLAQDPIIHGEWGNIRTNNPSEVIESVRNLESLSENSFDVIVDELRAYSKGYFGPLKPLQR